MATGDELAKAIDRQRQAREAMAAESERIKAERAAEAAKNPTNVPTPPPLGGKVAP